MLGESRLVYLVDFCLCTWSIIELVFSFEIARRVKSFTSRNFSYYERKSFPFHPSSVYAEVETNFVQKISAKKKTRMIPQKVKEHDVFLWWKMFDEKPCGSLLNPVLSYCCSNISIETNSVTIIIIITLAFLCCAFKHILRKQCFVVLLTFHSKAYSYGFVLCMHFFLVHF